MSPGIVGVGKEEMEVERRWEELPIDCFLTVMNKLTLAEKTLSVPFVCKSWHEALLLPQFWKVLNFYPLYVKSWDSFAERFMQQHHNLRSFSFSGFLKLVVRRSQRSAEEIIFHREGGTWEDLLYVSNECPALRILVLPDLGYECDFSMLAREWNGLERLYMGNINLPFEEALLQICEHFKNLRGLQYDGFIEDNSVLSNLSLLPNLTYLCLSGLSGLSNEGLHLVLDGCKNLEELYIRNTSSGIQVDETIIGKSSGIRTFVFDVGFPPEKFYEREYPYLRFEYGRVEEHLIFYASRCMKKL